MSIKEEIHGLTDEMLTNTVDMLKWARAKKSLVWPDILILYR